MPSERYISSPSKTAVPYDPEPILAELKKALNKRKKSELVDAMMEMASQDESLRRDMELRFEVQIPVTSEKDHENLKTIVEETRRAIAKATQVDEKRINYNFDYDRNAYELVQRNLQQLIDVKQFESAAALAIELMKMGSYQIEMSDEGMMTEDIENCLRPVIHGLKKSGLPQEQISRWIKDLQFADSCGFVCGRDLIIWTK